MLVNICLIVSNVRHQRHLQWYALYTLLNAVLVFLYRFLFQFDVRNASSCCVDSSSCNLCRALSVLLCVGQLTEYVLFVDVVSFSCCFLLLFFVNKLLIISAHL